MRARTGLVLLTALVAVAGCQKAPQEIWFGGGFEAAKVEAEARKMMIMMDFHSDT